MRHSISDEPDFISLYFPLALLTTTTLVEPERLCFLRTCMVQRIHFFACATQNRPIILRNSLIIIIRHLMANKSDEVRLAGLALALYMSLCPYSGSGTYASS